MILSYYCFACQLLWLCTILPTRITGLIWGLVTVYCWAFSEGVSWASAASKGIQMGGCCWEVVMTERLPRLVDLGDATLEFSTDQSIAEQTGERASQSTGSQIAKRTGERKPR